MSTELAARIKAARERKGWTQQQLADAVGVTRGSVRNWEAGVSPKNSLSRVEDALGVLLTGPDVAPAQEDASHVLLDLPDDALEGLSQVERDEVITAARLAALSKAREIRGGSGS